MFNRGFDRVEEEGERVEKQRKLGAGRIFRFFMGDRKEVHIKFLTSEPINFYEHVVPVTRRGKDAFDNILCTEDKYCKLCKEGDRASMKSAFMIYVDEEFEYTDRNGKTHEGDGRIFLYVVGISIAGVLASMDKRHKGAFH